MRFGSGWKVVGERPVGMILLLQRQKKNCKLMEKCESVYFVCVTWESCRMYLK